MLLVINIVVIMVSAGAGGEELGKSFMLYGGAGELALAEA